MAETSFRPSAHSAIADVIAAFPAMSLAEVDALAGLQTRRDRKYVLHPEQAVAAVAALGNLGDHINSMQIEHRRRFTYHSLYFDTPDLRSFRATTSGRRLRYKVRTRQYVDNDLCFMEVKTQQHRDETVKERIVHPFREPQFLTDQARDFVDQRLQQPGLAQTLQPVIWTGYTRTTLIDTQDRSRYTIDEDLSMAAPDGPWRRLGASLVIETKAIGNATPLDHLLWRSGIRPVALSKFGVSMALEHPELQSNKYHRVIQQHFCPPHLSSAVA